MKAAPRHSSYHAADAVPHIISVSRRCDIPATHASWFLHCLRTGRASFTHPYTRARLTVSLAPQDVIGFVFWSKDFSNFHEVLAEVRSRGYLFYCLYTITGLGEPFERHATSVDDRIHDFQKLADHFGPDCVVWRFDPIVLTPTITTRDTLMRFAEIARRLSSCTRTCIVSFVQQYPHVQRRLATRGVQLDDPPFEEKQRLLQQMANVACYYGISLHVCCQDEFVTGPIKKAHCVDIWRFRQLALAPLPNVPRQPSRPHCGCSASIDIGSYHACPHACLYCYARSNDGSHATATPNANTC